MSPIEFLNELNNKYRFMARDRSGSWYAFVGLPTLDDFADMVWYDSKHYDTLLLGEGAGIESDDLWIHSLVTRDPIKKELMAPQEMFNHLDEGYKFVAMDKNRTWYAYQVRPTLDDFSNMRWRETEPLDMLRLDEDTGIEYFGAWKDSLFEREDKEK